MSRLGKGLDSIEEMLQPGEEVLATILAAKCDPPTGKVGKYGGVLAVTNSRLLFSGKYLIQKSESAHQLSQVSSFNMNKSALVAQIQVHLTGTHENYTVKFREAKDFIAIAQSVLAKVHSNTNQQSSNNSSSVSDEILKLADLHNKGILSDDEFAKTKARLLDS